ncbi:hypothetical protein BJ165DRAFT_1486944 [Panaeolus papilionaceus]|nr:hypothetical protein BJ165DRAFT_1486944 [Panaeolus papilionaceus]
MGDGNDDDDVSKDDGGGDDNDRQSSGQEVSMSDEESSRVDADEQPQTDTTSKGESDSDQSIKSVTTKDLKAILELDSKEVLQFGRVKIGKNLENADLAIACDLVRRGENNRDPSYVKYDLFVDKNARNSRPPSFELQSFFGLLKRVFVLDIPDSPEFGIKAETVILALVREAKVKTVSNLPCYKELGALEVIDLATIKCVVGRVHDRKHWYILDRT